MREIPSNDRYEDSINDEDRIQVEISTGRIGFIYDNSPDMTFAFDLLSEVGEHVKPTFKDYLEQRGWELDTAETATDYFNVVKDWDKIKHTL